MEKFNGVLKKNKKAEELISRKDLDGTPFTIITVEDEYFGVMGKYRITEKYKSFELAKAEAMRLDWNNVIKIISLICHEFIENKEELEKLIIKE